MTEAEMIAERISADARLRAIEVGIELEGSALFRALADCLDDEKEAAVADMLGASPADFGAVAKAQVRMRAAVALQHILAALRNRARSAEADVYDEERSLRENHDRHAA